VKFRIRLANQIVGLFILIAIVGLVAALILLGANQRWFAEKLVLKSRFKSGAALSVGMAVTLRGFEIGRVEEKILDPENLEVIIDFQIYDEYYDQVVLPNSVLELAVSPLGGSTLLFHPGKPQAPPVSALPPGSWIPSLDFDQGMELVRRELVERRGGGDTITTLLSDIGPVLENVNDALFNLKKLTLTIEDGLKGDRSTQLGSLLHSIDTLVSSLDDFITGRNTGPFGDVLSNVDRSLANVDASVNKITKDFEKTAADATELIAEAKQTIDQDVSKILGNVDKIALNIEELTADPTGLAVELIDPKGSIATLLNDNNALYDNILQSIENVNAIVAELEEFAAFLTGMKPQISGILEEGRTTVNEAQDVIEALKNNPLLKRGIQEPREQPTTTSGYRDEEF